MSAGRWRFELLLLLLQQQQQQEQQQQEQQQQEQEQEGSVGGVRVVQRELERENGGGADETGEDAREQPPAI